MKRLIFLPLMLIFVVSCGNTQTDNQIKQNADAAENFIYLVLNEPDEAKKLMHDDFTFRYMGKIPVYAQGISVIKKSYDKETYFEDFLEVVGALLPGGIVLTPLDVIADEDSAAVIMVGDAEGAYGEYDNEYVFTFKFKDGKIIEVDDKFLKVSLDNNIIGTIKKSNLSKDKNEQRVDRFALDEQVDSIIISVDQKTRTLNLSIKEIEINDEKEALSKYGSSDSGASLGDILGSILKKKE